MKSKIRKTSIILLWLLIWQMAAMIIQNDILLSGPLEVGKRFLELSAEPEFYKTCIISMGRILAGFCLAFVSGVIIGALSYRFAILKEIMEPFLAVIKSIPVASFVVLLLIWQGAANLSVFISFLVVFPNTCISTRNGCEAVDPKLKEMADVFEIRGIRRALFIYRPSLVSYLISGMEISIGMAFKSGVAAEVIGVPEFSIGERIYMSKIFLDTPGLFAWTFTLIVLSAIAEKLILKGMQLALRPVKMHLPVREIKDGKKQQDGVRISQISKSFGEKKVLCNVDMQLQKGACYLLMGPSGSGKTTLLRILARLENADVGTIENKNGKVAYLFQEDRLLENEFTINNIMLTYSKKMTTGKSRIGRRAEEEFVKEAALEILPEDCLKKTASLLSGGMKRRCALVRTMLYRLEDENTLCLLDEPFAGLDEETKKRAAAFIRKYQKGRTMVVATHDEEDAELLGGTIWRIAE